MRSIYLLGADTQTEWQLVDLLGGPPNRFFQLAPRIAWGISQPDLVRIDVIECARRLVRSHGTAFPAHVFDAWVWRVRDPDRAERALERARALGGADHPLAYLLPSHAEWHAEPLQQTLVQVTPDIWRVAHQFALAGAPFFYRSTATLVRTRDGDLAMFNPVALDAAVAEQIAALGTVRWLCSQGKAHSAFIEPVRRRFRDAVVLGTEGHLSHPPAAHLELDGILGRHALPVEFELLPIDGHLLEEVVVLHRPSATLIVQDLVMGAARSDTPWLGRLYSFTFGMIERLGFPSYQLFMWRDVRAFHTSLRKLRDSGFTRVAIAHGAAALADTDAQSLRAAFDEALDIGPLGHKLLLARVSAAQPSFVADSLRYLRATRNAVGARIRP